MDPVKTLGIDQSINATGLVYMKDGKMIASQCIEFKEAKPRPTYERFDITCKAVEEYIGSFEPDYVELEGLSFGSKGDTVFRLAALKGCIELTLQRNGYSEATTDNLAAGKKRLWAVVPPSRMKAFCLGDGGVKKDTSYLIKVMERVKQNFHNDNIADAYMHALFMSMLVRVMPGTIEVSGLPEWQQETLMKDGVARRKGLSLNKALKLSEGEKYTLVRQMEL